MRIINGRLPLNIKRITGVLSVAPLSVSDEILADYNTLRTLMISYSPEDVKIFMDSSTELQLFKSVNLSPKDHLKEQFLVTDLEDGIAKVITPLKEAQEKEDAERLAAQKEIEEMASYKEKYLEADAELKKLKLALDDSMKSVEVSDAKINELTDKLTAAEGTTTELRNALKVATEKIESMKFDFNAACQHFAISRNANGEWQQDFMKAVPDGYLVVSEADAKKSDVALKTAKDDVDKLKSENAAQDEQIVKLHTEIGKICAKFNLAKGADGEYYSLSGRDSNDAEFVDEESIDESSDESSKDAAESVE